MGRLGEDIEDRALRNTDIEGKPLDEELEKGTKKDIVYIAEVKEVQKMKWSVCQIHGLYCLKKEKTTQGLK